MLRILDLNDLTMDAMLEERAEGEGGHRGRPGRARTDSLAFVISALASPFLVMPLFAVLITAHYAPDPGRFALWAGVAAFFSTGVPLAYIGISVRAGTITDIHVMRREQRSGPFVVALFSSGTGAAVLHLIGAPMQLVVLGLCIVVNGIAFALITLRWKISMHPSVYAASVLAAVFLLDARCAWLLAFLPAIIWARVRRTRHSAAQGVVATLLAGAITLAVLGAFGYLGA